MRVADLFSGCGGLTSGLESTGFQVVVAIEQWAAARATYSSNFDHPVLDLDIAGVDTVVEHLQPLDLDMIVGGPPCQDFSAAGGRSEGSRARLTVSFASVVASIKPTWFVLENVPQARESEAWASARRILTRAGYGISECVLNAAYFDVPQVRKRFFAVGRLGEDDHFLDCALETRKRTSPMTVKEYLGDKLGVDFYYRHPRNWGRKAIFSIGEPSATIRSTNRPVPPGYSAHSNDAGPLESARPLTARERACIQTFPESFVFTGTTTDQDMMIANAVPVALARHVGSKISEYEANRANGPQDLRFRSWLVSEIGLTQRSAGNVVCRLRRITKILKKKQLSTDPVEVVTALRRRKTYRELTTSVRSQLKRAAVLFAQFKAARESG